MFDDLDRSLKALLVEQLPLINEQIRADGFDVRFEAPTREFNGKRGGKATLSLYLYNIQENRDLRGRTWERRLEDGAFASYRPPAKLDCLYLVTAWANEVEDEHRLLAAAARVLFRTPVIPDALLPEPLQAFGPVTTEVAQPESFKDVVDIWSVLDADLRPSLRVTVTVPLDLNVPRPPKETAPPVTELPRIRVEAPQEKPLRPTSVVSGTVLRGGEPVANAVIRVGHSSAVADRDGAYALAGVPEGISAVLVAADRQLYMLELDLRAQPKIEIAGSANTTAATDSSRRKTTRPTQAPSDGD